MRRLVYAETKYDQRFWCAVFLGGTWVVFWTAIAEPRFAPQTAVTAGRVVIGLGISR